MKTNEVFKFYQEMIEKHFVLSFKGSISQEMLVEMGEMIKSKFTYETDQKKLPKYVFGIFIEIAQNVLHHSAEKIKLENKENDVGTGIIDISENKDFYKIISGNLIENEKVENVINRCNYLNGLDREGLKKFYKECIKLPRAKGNKGAGLGLIDVSRKSGNPILTKVNKIDDIYSFLIISVNIKKKEK